MNNIADTIIGLDFGSSYAHAKQSEDEIKKGKNYFLSATSLGMQAITFANILNVVNTNRTVPSSVAVPITLMALQILAIPICLFAASVRSGTYEETATLINEHFGYEYLPIKLGETGENVCHFICNDGGKVLQVAVVVSSVALIAMGKIAIGAAILTAITYQYLDSEGYIPFKASLLIENNLPFVKFAGDILGGTIITQIFAIFSAGNNISYTADYIHIIHGQFDRLVSYIQTRFIGEHSKVSREFLREVYNHESDKPIHRVFLDEFETPIKEKRNLTDEEIRNILFNNPELEVEPSHCNKFSDGDSTLPQNHEFDKFSEYFNEISWDGKEKIIRGKLLDDDRFLDFVMTTYMKKNLASEELKELIALKETDQDINDEVAVKQEVRKQNETQTTSVIRKYIKENFDTVIKMIAEKEGKTSNQYLLEWTQEQMKGLVDGMMLRRPLEGSRKDIEDAQLHCSKVLAHIVTMPNGCTREDMLLKMAVEGGYYCPKGVKGAAKEIITSILQENLEKQNKTLDSQQGYEIDIKQLLEFYRTELLQAVFTLDPAREMKADDKHLNEGMSDIWGLGFLPMTHFQRRKIEFFVVMMSRHIATEAIRDAMFNVYEDRLQGRVYQYVNRSPLAFSAYILTLINNNTSLTQDQKDNLLEIYTEQNEDAAGNKQWTQAQTERRFANLMLVQLGILRVKKA